MLLELAEYFVCFKWNPLSFCLYSSSCVSFQVVGNWDQLDDEGKGTPVGCTCSSHGPSDFIVFLHLNSTAQHCRGVCGA
jgi:hypothetical protein